MTDTTGSAKVDRPTSRVILVDPDGRVLLMGGIEQGRWIWITPGGACWTDEDHAAAACRELAEETGLRIEAERLGPPVAMTAGEWTAASGTVYAASDQYFAALVDSFTPVTDAQEEFERAWIQEFRWWTADEIDATDQVVWPVGLANLVRRLAAGDRPAEPLQLPWDL